MHCPDGSRWGGGGVEKVARILCIVYIVEHKTCDIFAAERLRLMRFDNRLIIDSFQEDICIIDEREVVWRGL